jgi:hypothetical protein
MSPSGEAGIEALEFEEPIFDIGFGVGLPTAFELVGTG